MTTVEFITELFCHVDDAMAEVPKHRQAKLYPSELVTLGRRFALKGDGERAFYRWLSRDYRPLFPQLPHRTRLFRWLKIHRAWTDRFLAAPSLIGVADTYGIELGPPWREGRSANQLGAKGLSNHRWIVGAKVGVVVNHLGWVVGWDCNPANVSDTEFRPLVAQFVDRMVVLTDSAFHGKWGDPSNMKVCRRGTWNPRMLLETVWSMLTKVCHFKPACHLGADYFRARMACVFAAFNLLVQW
ncbi:MAG: transposase, partial [Acidobacteria bacterium]|nr:transposase [Acidobacteriota bacterium]